MMTNLAFRLGAGLAVVFCTLFHDQYVFNNKENQNNILYYFILVVLTVFDNFSSF
jgi:hypothetical protein